MSDYLTRIKSAAIWESLEKPYWLCDACLNDAIKGIEYSVIDCRSQGKCSECGKVVA